ncbi:MAG TPA: transporter substrate-binding domain-containing protein [Pyrinomonadaceae bacterium]|nr:transporter substrate-binding domain-containing protein [Pyrinomonadaceae bacterium]
MPTRRIVAVFLVVSAVVAAVAYLWVRSERRAREQDEAREIGPVEAAGTVPLGPPIERDFAAIKERGTLVVLAPYNSTTYFLYRGEPLGYEYELLRAFAQEHGLALQMEVVTNQKTLYQRLNRGDGDVVAARLNPKPEDEPLVSFTRPLYRTEPALVQQKAPPDEAKLTDEAKTEIKSEPADVQTPEAFDVEARLITRPAQLAGEEVTLPEGSAYKKTLIELADEISGDITVVEVGGRTDDEAIISKVAKGDVEYTVVQGNLAELKEAYFSNLKIRPIVGASHKVVWAVRKNAPALQEELDRWIEEKKNSGLFDKMYKKYFTDRKGYKERVASEYLTSETGKLCRFDPLLRQYAGELNWDWRLLASQAYQESRFDPAARSWAGATGLLQLMPATAKQFGVQNLRDPEDNVRGAVKFLKWLTDYWSERIPDERERLKFILASYNTGAGHVEDAQRLAEKYGGNPKVWNDVAYWLLQKSKVQFTTDPVVKYGFCRGIEPVTYVSLILERFEHYKHFVVT